jgi:putative tricarboxylic transport membrane protein
MTTPEPGPGARRGALLGLRLVAAALLGLAAILIVSALGVAAGGGYSVVGPATVPLVVAIGLLVLAAIFAVRTTVVPDADLGTLAAEEEAVTHWPVVGLAAAGLVAYALALDGFDLGPLEIPGLGYIVATALFMPLTARILGSRSPARDTIVGLGIALVIYFGFTEFLGVRLPDGILGPVL